MNNAKVRLDKSLFRLGLVSSRSQAENFIKLGKVTVDGAVVTKPGFLVSETAKIKLESDQYVSRAGLKLASVAKLLNLDFRGKTVLDVGSSTGGFTDYALQNGAVKVIAVDVGTDQLHPKLRKDSRIELHEKTDIRDVYLAGPAASVSLTSKISGDFSRQGIRLASPTKIDIVVIDVSFISLREILPHIAENLADKQTQIVAMLKPQFEAGRQQVNKGVIKNDSVRRKILQDFEVWAKTYFVIQDKRDSEVAGTKGNRERFYLLKVI